MVFEGRLPSKTRWGTSQSGVPSALTCSAVLPKASASAWGEDIGQEHVVMAAERVERLAERNEVAWDQPGALVDQLVKGVLAVGPRLARYNHQGFPNQVGPRLAELRRLPLPP